MKMFFRRDRIKYIAIKNKLNQALFLGTSLFYEKVFAGSIFCCIFAELNEIETTKSNRYGIQF